jgi:predicted secreted protein
MTSTALTAQGTSISVDTSATNVPDLTPVVNVSEISGFDGAATAIDVTDLLSAAAETVMGLQKWGNISLTTSINLKEPSHAALLAAKKSGLAKGFEVTLPDATTLAFQAFVSSFPIGAKVDGVVTGAIALAITGDITVTVATGS